MPYSLAIEVRRYHKNMSLYLVGNKKQNHNTKMTFQCSNYISQICNSKKKTYVFR